ncbi:hypothetical protein FB45DRAFT_1005654 [Roridomyces roridus]|uniref:Uncharacterized protein n=1 Tax=Roridomyces roridus TaxID=1738132 RepID=A0AAD7FHW3_9AGAR|nr:hypothetical protein FB45DRAFT_1005654 [Roridomyces roridus]
MIEFQSARSSKILDNGLLIIPSGVKMSAINSESSTSRNYCIEAVWAKINQTRSTLLCKSTSLGSPPGNEIRNANLKTPVYSSLSRSAYCVSRAVTTESTVSGIDKCQCGRRQSHAIWGLPDIGRPPLPRNNADLLIICCPKADSGFILPSRQRVADPDAPPHGYMRTHDLTPRFPGPRRRGSKIVRMVNADRHQSLPHGIWSVAGNTLEYVGIGTVNGSVGYQARSQRQPDNQARSAIKIILPAGPDTNMHYLTTVKTVPLMRHRALHIVDAG